MKNSIKINDLQHLDVVDVVDLNKIEGGVALDVTLGVVFEPFVSLDGAGFFSATVIGGAGSINGQAVSFGGAGTFLA
ncbi:hypothetical protein Xen7305DRAFT_00035350 [Xenococcus sp. PCC 7305]|uniref:hypothetical protein n=1 Tax=Xenococcus sp. PCC 7305 TaxID=102125 RepID=UPI0002AC29DD|nr:hypothetical protein [Xenococcus sp. PCC 7305]ELS03811.1 hypothetical protein Xen7305DRAFT_00035350 [Xenococcus sp. PCC 7305]